MAMRSREGGLALATFHLNTISGAAQYSSS